MVNRQVNRVVHASFTPFLILSSSGGRPLRTRSVLKKSVRLFPALLPCDFVDVSSFAGGFKEGRAVRPRMIIIAVVLVQPNTEFIVLPKHQF